MTVSEDGGGASPQNSENTLEIDDALLSSLGLDDLVPASWAAWRPLVREGLAFFLSRLSGQRLESILLGQWMLPDDAPPAQRLVSLFSHCPTLHKIGQVLARHRPLPLPLRRQLQSLESLPASVEISEVLADIRKEIGDAPITLGDAALAEGSVAVIVPFTYQAQAQLRHGVFKVLKPGIEEKVANELRILADMDRFLAQRSRALGLPALNFGDTLRTVQQLLVNEIQFENEQTNLRLAAAFYAHEPRVLVPALLPWCTHRLTAMERVFGAKVTDVALSPEARQSLADTLVAALLGQPFWNTSACAVFHADLHAGNLLLATDGRLAILDWSLTASLSKAQREALMAMALGGLTLDAPRICQAAAALGLLPADDPALARAVEQALDRLVFESRLPGFDWLMQLQDAVAVHADARFEDDFLLFRKTWFSLFGVLGDLAEQSSPDIPMLNLGLKRFFAEVPERFGSYPDSPIFSTHVSNADILAVFTSSMLTAARYWARRWDRQVFRLAP